MEEICGNEKNSTGGSRHSKGWGSDFGDAERTWAIQGKMGIPRGKVEVGETSTAALLREMKEEMDAEVEIGELVHTVEYNYPDFHLSMDCFFCSIHSGQWEMKEHLDARWLKKEELDSVEWLPADVGLIELLKRELG